MFSGSGPWTLSGSNVYVTNTNNNVGIGTTNPDEKLSVVGDARISGNAYSSKIVVDPSSGVGWYRIASVGGSTGGTVYVLAWIDNRHQRLEFNYNIRSYISSAANVGQITVLRTLSYNNGPISKIRIGANSGPVDYNTYLDIYVNSATTPEPFTIYGTNGARFLSSPIYNPPTPTYTKEIDLSGNNFRGIYTTDGAIFAGISGNVGIGTTAPSQKLHVEGNAYISGNVGIGTTNPSYKLHVEGTGYFSQPVVVGTPTAASHAATKSYVDSMFSGSGPWTLSGSNVYVTNVNNNVGIGTTTPDRKLTIYNANFAYMNLKDGTREVLLGVDSSGAILSAMSNHDLILRAGGNSEKMRITAIGNVGIGTTNPSYKLHVEGTGYFSQPVVVGTPTAASHAATKSYVDSMFSGSGPWTLSGSNVYVTNTNNNVGIGTTDPAYKLDIHSGYDGKVRITGTPSSREDGVGFLIDTEVGNMTIVQR